MAYLVVENSDQDAAGFELSRFAGARFSLLMAGFACALILTVWGAIVLQVSAERDAMNRSISQQTANLSLVFKSSVNRTASEMDRVLRYLRTTYEGNGYQADWPTLVQAEFAANKRTVQIAVIDEHGTMITSSKMLYPKRPIDLSFRKHYKIHAQNKVDRLYISEPLVGKASGKWSVQFARPFFKKDRSFGGVIVVSLDPNFLTRDYASLDLGADGGLAVVGNDGIYRAVSGRYQGLLGKVARAKSTTNQSSGVGSGAVVENSDDGPIATAVQQSSDFPLRMITTRDGTSSYVNWLTKRQRYHWGGTFFTALVLFTAVVGMTWRQRYERNLNALARHDGLTKLANRMEFQTQLDALRTDRWRKREFNVLLIDLDDFKSVNDTFGHPVADQVLVEISKRLCDVVRAGDIVARLGGDEFAIVQVDSSDEKSGEALATRVTQALTRPMDIDGTLVETGCSIGLAIDGQRFEDVDEVMRAADLALYSAKRDGRGIHRVFRPKMTEEARARMEVELGLREALRENQLFIYYQPIIDVRDRRTLGVEALLRWQHPEKGMISPGEFIPVAEQTGLINRIGPWMIESACKQIASVSEDLFLAVNVSAIEFRDTDVAATVKNALEVSGLAPSRLKIEITESLLLRKDSSTRGQLSAIRDHGVTVAMDDFGTGYSSLSYLHEYPIDQIKIDQSFTRRIGELNHAEGIVRAIVALARCMNIGTVAEGIETEQQYETVADAGCDQGQGYLFSKPVPLEELVAGFGRQTNQAVEAAA